MLSDSNLGVREAAILCIEVGLVLLCSCYRLHSLLNLIITELVAFFKSLE